MRANTKTPDIFINSPVILDISTTSIIKIADDEIFVELPFNGNYAISNYARLYSKKRRRILKPQKYGRPKKDNDYYYYKLKDKDGIYRNYKASRLVSEIFIHNPDPIRKTEIHHKNGRYDDSYKSLMWVSRGEHRLIENNKKLYLYNGRNKKLIKFDSIESLCSHLNIKMHIAYYTLHQKEPCYTLYNRVSMHKLNARAKKGEPLFIVMVKTPTKKECAEMAQALVICGALLLAGLQMLKTKRGGVV